MIEYPTLTREEVRQILMEQGGGTFVEYVGSELRVVTLTVPGYDLYVVTPVSYSTAPIVLDWWLG